MAKPFPPITEVERHGGGAAPAHGPEQHPDISDLHRIQRYRIARQHLEVMQR